MPATPANQFSDKQNNAMQLGYQSSALDIIQSTNATLSPKILNQKLEQINRNNILNTIDDRNNIYSSRRPGDSLADLNPGNAERK